MTCVHRSSFVLALIASGCLAGAAAEKPAAPSIPICPGLTIVTAIAQQSGDYESIKTIEAAGPKEVSLKYSSESFYSDWGFEGLKKVALNRTLLTADLETANFYQQTFLEKSAETIPGTTSIGTSAAVLKALKTKGEAEMSVSNSYAGLELSADRKKFPSYYDYKQSGKIKRVGAGPARISVLVNDRLVDLPAIRAEGDFVGDKAEFFFLDDERNPLTLAFRLGIGAVKPLTADELSLCETLRKSIKGPSKGPINIMLPGSRRCDLVNGGDQATLRVIKITYRCAAPLASQSGAPGTGAGQLPGGGGQPSAGPSADGVRAIEQALATTGKVDIYSIYFSFDSDLIREESEPTLREIAEVMRRHPDWKLGVNGHTDGVGGDQYNLDLSRKRAGAVKDALVKRYRIDGGRLGTSGLGKSQPKDTNDTLEGRARNRRVELVKGT
jgi:outer membrane protein OmpA-like peptidoglycan-associated protein